MKIVTHIVGTGILGFVERALKKAAHPSGGAHAALTNIKLLLVHFFSHISAFVKNAPITMSNSFHPLKWLSFAHFLRNIIL